MPQNHREKGIERKRKKKGKRCSHRMPNGIFFLHCQLLLLYYEQIHFVNVRDESKSVKNE